MTWTYERTDGGVTIRDHDGTEITTLENNGRGLVLPDDILTVMSSEFDTAVSNHDFQRAFQIIGDASFEQIEEYDSDQ